MSEKKIRLGSAILRFLVVPIVFIGCCFLIMFPTLLYSFYPLEKIPSYESPNDALSILDISLTNLTSADNFATVSITCEESYNILVNSSRQPPGFSLMQISPGWLGFSAVLVDYPSDNSTFFFKDDGKAWWDEYRTWKYSCDAASPFKWMTQSFPIDTFESPPIYVWADDKSYPTIKLETPAISGFVVSLRPLGLADPMAVYQSESLIQKLAFSLPNSAPYGFQIVIQRDPSSVTLYSSYFFFIFIVIYLVGTFSRLVTTDIDKRLGIIATLSISVIAFLWTLRQIAGSITYLELILFFDLIFFIALEIADKTDFAPLRELFNEMTRKWKDFEKRLKRGGSKKSVAT